MNVEIYYDAGIEIDIPVDIDDVEDYIEENEELNKQFNDAVNKGIQEIHDKLSNTFGSDGYDEEGGFDEFNVDEIPPSKEYLKGKKDLAKDILDKIDTGYGTTDIIDLVKAWGREDE